MMQQQMRRRRCRMAMAVAAVALATAVACSPDEPKPPTAIDESASLVGTDANNDGVRDDIEKVVADLPVNQETKAHLLELAASEQEVMALDLSGNPEATRAKAYDLATKQFALDCVPAGVDKAEWRTRSESLLLLILNTDQRNAQEESFNKLVDGRAFPLPDCGA
jgi:hypothetical protein